MKMWSASQGQCGEIQVENNNTPTPCLYGHTQYSCLLFWLFCFWSPALFKSFLPILFHRARQVEHCIFLQLTFKALDIRSWNLKREKRVLLWFVYLSVCESVCSTDSQICKHSNAPQTLLHTDAYTSTHTYTHVYSHTQQIHMHIPYCHILCLQGDELAVMVHLPQMDF